MIEAIQSNVVACLRTWGESCGIAPAGGWSNAGLPEFSLLVAVGVLLHSFWLRSKVK